MSKKYIAVAVLAFSLVGGVALATHSWGGYHWARTSNPFTLKVGDNVSTSWKSYLGTTATNWSLSPVLDMSVVPGKSKGNCQPTLGRVEVCNRTYGNNGWLGIAQVWVSGLHITQATTKMNDTYFNTPTYNTPAWKNMVMCQEVGHTLGLDHQDENFSNANLGTCMDYTNDPARNDGAGTNLQPNAHDYEELALIYAHADSGTTIKSSDVTKNNASEDDWGKSIKKDSHGKDSTFEKDLGKGDKVFTFVIWAE